MVTRLSHSQVFDLIQEAQVALLGVQINNHYNLVVLEIIHVVHVIGGLDGSQHVAAIVDIFDLSDDNLLGETRVFKLVIEQGLQMNDR